MQPAGLCNYVTPPWAPQSSVTLCSWSHGWSLPQLSTVTHLCCTFITIFISNGCWLPSNLISIWKQKDPARKASSLQGGQGTKMTSPCADGTEGSRGVMSCLAGTPRCVPTPGPSPQQVSGTANSRNQAQKTAQLCQQPCSGWAGARQGSHTQHRIFLTQYRACWERGTLQGVHMPPLWWPWDTGLALPQRPFAYQAQPHQLWLVPVSPVIPRAFKSNSQIKRATAQPLCCGPGISISLGHPQRQRVSSSLNCPLCSQMSFPYWTADFLSPVKIVIVPCLLEAQRQSPIQKASELLSNLNL